ncbi:hypothetical protein WOLCODRAFT_67732 [Wolfiporia cocos MD-104 SS10]|uniref:Uncharacterized protein n=1 Tax=Wolfiporia cocos (strain MD-104) TaxID=742152 RepID=A0A2H3JIZ1_WOLCO|nr:hypothetical protein WOLCODRAFT_67732 [Wolfiporia cocos MD-104 SS10]
MSSVSPLPLNSGYASPAPLSTTPPIPKPNAHSKPNVFSNDGSFLERFQRIKKARMLEPALSHDEEEKKKQEEILAQKRNFDERFKRRGKRPPPTDANSTPATEPPAKKTRADEPLTQYQKEVKNYAGRSLKDDGIGVRPLVK